jgi:hypothetical protein
MSSAELTTAIISTDCGSYENNRVPSITNYHSEGPSRFHPTHRGDPLDAPGLVFRFESAAFSENHMNAASNEPLEIMESQRRRPGESQATSDQ